MEHAIDPIEALSIFAEATQDLVTAGVELALGRFFACADACNQSAEKALQAVYVARNSHRATYDHDLHALAELVGAPSAVLEDVATLSPYHPETFYAHTAPELADDEVTPEAAADCLARARRTQRWARGIVVEDRP